MIVQRKKSWAYDLSDNIEKTGEVFDVVVINQSIENILSTMRGERLFLIPYGSDLPLVLFENVDESNGEQILDSILDSIEAWEDRIILLRTDARLQLASDQNSIILTIPYYIKEQAITTTFDRKIFI